MFEEKFSEFEKFIAENKGKRKFKQSVELAVNFKDIDFSKQDNRLNLDIILPNGRGKASNRRCFRMRRSKLIAEASIHCLRVSAVNCLRDLLPRFFRSISG